MKTTAFAAVAALVAVAPMASAQTTGSPQPADEDAMRTTALARSLVATMQGSARFARSALEHARAGRNPDEVRCADEALSRADVALRHGREDEAVLVAQLAARDAQGAWVTLERLRQRWAASRSAAVSASYCAAIRAAGADDRTTVIVHATAR